jgi:hypothetical protein
MTVVNEFQNEIESFTSDVKISDSTSPSSSSSPSSFSSSFFRRSSKKLNRFCLSGFAAGRPPLRPFFGAFPPAK